MAERVLTEAEQKALHEAQRTAFVSKMTDAEAHRFGDSIWEAAREYYAPESADDNLSPSEFMQSEVDSIDAAEEVAEGDDVAMRHAIVAAGIGYPGFLQQGFIKGWDAHVAFVATLRDRDAIQVREAHVARRIAEDALTAERERREELEEALTQLVESLSISHGKRSETGHIRQKVKRDAVKVALAAARQALAPQPDRGER